MRRMQEALELACLAEELFDAKDLTKNHSLPCAAPSRHAHHPPTIGSFLYCRLRTVTRPEWMILLRVNPSAAS